MIIDRADRFGLADLHQLRGRVGRSDQKAFCYLFVPSVHSLAREARHRLRAIEEFSDLGSGFNIAMRDLDIRGAGNLLGAEQSGFIDEIGFETYHRILDEAVSELRNEEFKDLFEQDGAVPKASESLVDVESDALIPSDYVANPTQRLDLYRRLAQSVSEEEVNDILEEMRDRFGPEPEEVERLIVAVKMKVLAGRLRLPRVEFKRNRLFLTVPAQDDTVFYETIFQPLLASLTSLDHRFVIKEAGSKTRLIVQEVADIQAALDILSVVQVG
jgi:transcription-repair coupling factor (superfamily II helicase)